MSLSWPTTAAVGQRFGANPSSIQPNGHTGMDFPMPIGTPLYAADSGNVMYADWATKLSASNPWWIAPAYAGIVVVINHNDGRLTLYAHLNETHLNPGQFVEKGQLIGKSGTTGLSTGPHLHFEVIGWPLNPNNGFYGRLNPSAFCTGFAQPQVAPQSSETMKVNQRKVGPDNVSHRAQSNTASPVIRTINANTIETFNGFVRGENVKGIDLWYQDDQGFAWAGGFTEQKTDGLVEIKPAPEPAPLGKGQRKVAVELANYRELPHTSSKVLQTYKKGDILTFSHWTHGEFVENTDIWFKGAISGGYLWAGSVENPNESELLEEASVPSPQPQPSATMVKKVVPEGVRLRTLPNTSGQIKTVVPGNTEVTASGYVVGERVNDSDVWFVVPDGYIHASGLTDASTGSLPKKETPPAPADNTPAYSFTPDFDFVEYRPANTHNMQDGNFPVNPEKIVIHQFDAKDKRPSLDGVITHFQTERSNPSSAHFGISGTRIVQFVSLKDRAFHAGTVGNNYIGIEVDPQEDEATVASVKKLIYALNKKYSKTFEYTRHRDVPGNSTLCGADITLEKYKVSEAPVPAPVTPPTPPAPEPVPVVVPVPEPTPVPAPVVIDEEAIIDEFLAFWKAEFLRRKKQ